MKRFVGVVACAVGLAACLVGVGCAGETGSVGNAITVSASVTAEVAPDKGAVTVVAAAEGDTVEKARAAGEDVAGDIAAACVALGVAPEDISRPEITTTERVGTKAEQVAVDGYEDEFGNWIDVFETVETDAGVVGYDAAVSFEVANFDADKLGALVRDAAAAGATGFEDLTFMVGDSNAAYEQALAEAVDAAHAKAEALARAGGVYVGRVVDLVEDSDGKFEAAVSDDASTLDPSDESTLNVSPSKVPVKASVTVSYAIS